MYLTMQLTTITNLRSDRYLISYKRDDFIHVTNAVIYDIWMDFAFVSDHRSFV